MENDFKSPEGLSAAIPGTNPQYWAQLRFRGEGPRYLKPSPRKVLYRWSDVEAWLEGTARTSTAEAS
jgi:hypothetical protein